MTEKNLLHGHVNELLRGEALLYVQLQPWRQKMLFLLVIVNLFLTIHGIYFFSPPVICRQIEVYIFKLVKYPPPPPGLVLKN